MRTPAIHRICDGLSEVVLYFAVIFAPWAFGSTENWAIWMMNGAGYVLGALLFAKWIVRWKTGYGPRRWNEEYLDQEDEEDSPSPRSRTIPDPLTRALGLLTILLLAYCLLAAVNARGRYDYQGDQRFFSYLECLEWLPHSYDQTATWFAFFKYLGLALAYWATRDLLLGKTSMERHLDRERSLDLPLRVPSTLPQRMQRLIWVLCLNGAWLGIISILQRLDGTDKLLWVMERQSGYPPDFSFGSFAYRGNGAQYFNLLWPLCLGFWRLLNAEPSEQRQMPPYRGVGVHTLLVLAGLILILCPIVSRSMGGAFMVYTGLPVFGFWLFLNAKNQLRMKTVAFSLLAGAVWYVVLFLALDPWELYRSPTAGANSPITAVERRVQFESTFKMVSEHPVWGVGAEAYRSVYEFYLVPGQKLFAFAHNDWLQTLAELGWFGFAFLLVALLAVLIHALVHSHDQPFFAACLVFSLVLLFIQSWFDFPLQIQSIVFTTLVLLAILVSLPARPAYKFFAPASRKG